MKIDHIGYAVKDIDQALDEFKKLGYSKVGRRVTDKLRNIEIQFIEKDAYKIELISPSNDKSPISNILRKSGPGPYHICYQVGNIEEKIKELINNGYMLLEESEEAIAFDNRRIAFLYSKYLGIIELVEVQR